MRLGDLLILEDDGVREEGESVEGVSVLVVVDRRRHLGELALRRFGDMKKQFGHLAGYYYKVKVRNEPISHRSFLSTHNPIQSLSIGSGLQYSDNYKSSTVTITLSALTRSLVHLV